MVSLGQITVLLVVLTTKHLAADFFLQTGAMARGKAADRNWLWPLMVHAAAHAVLTLLIALAVRPSLWWIAVVELALHAALDRGKVLASRQAHLGMADEQFWWLFGVDQYLHQLTNIGIAVVLLAG